MKKLRIVYLAITTLSLLLLAQASCAAQSPVSMLNSTTDQLLSQLKANPSKTKNDPDFVYGLVRKLVLPNVDVTGMARSALGRTYWNQATPAQQQTFTKEFTTLMVQTYGSALSAYSDEQVKYYPTRGSLSGQQFTQVKSAIMRSDGPPINMYYSLVRKNNQWLVYDISIDGVSILRSFQSQFKSQVGELGMTAFLKKFAAHNRDKR